MCVHINVYILLWVSPRRKLRPPHSPSLAPTSIYCWAVWSERSLGLNGVSCPGCAPSQLSVHPQTMHQWGGMGWEAEKILKLCRHCLVITCFVINKCYFVQKSKHSTTEAAVKKINSIQTKTHYVCYVYVSNNNRNPQRNTWIPK